jgi:hypothetical protein
MGASRLHDPQPARSLFRRENDDLSAQMEAVDERLAGAVLVSEEGHLGHTVVSRSRRDGFKAALMTDGSPNIEGRLGEVKPFCP